ncbi:MAG: gamma-glutamyltransferase [Chromatiales bacterium]|nr:gamma-glutamyltransferase [Gammaproteobacteria bacterium]MCP5352453.1 gamma-glutamyltransferase [Chromatiales bacterium]
MPTSLRKGAVAAGHPLTANAARVVLDAGGNAYDAVLAAMCAASVVEPVLSSLGGGGFLLAFPGDGKPRLYDFFVQTPRRKRPPDEIDFRPIIADFGTAQQEFHIGLGSIATPGTVRGLFEIHRELGSLPMRDIVEPAITAARDGVAINRLQAYIFGVVAPIYLATHDARSIYASPNDATRLYGEGEVLRQPELADALDAIAREGDRLFYEGEIAAALTGACETGGGHLGADDLRAYRVEHREPLSWQYRDARMFTNPPPSSGGLLIRFAQELLAEVDFSGAAAGRPAHILPLLRVMEQTNLARREARGKEPGEMLPWLLDAERLARFRAAVAGHPLQQRGTTHISVIDTEGNAASMTLSNGEGCGWVAPGTGIMINNMLGEEDLNPGGFHRWAEDVRVSSMMAPTIALRGRERIALGSGGSNRLRTAILQVLVNHIDFGMPLDEAVERPRVHHERGLASIESGFPEETLRAIQESYPEPRVWNDLNLFFGGVHAVSFDGRELRGAGDPRRGGVFQTV